MSNRNDSDRISLIATILAFLVALGPPVVCSFVAIMANQGLMTATLIFVAFIGIEVIFDLLAKFWNGIKEPIIKGAIEDFLTRLQGQKYHREYVKDVYWKHRSFDGTKRRVTLEEFDLELQNVFIDLSVSPETNFPPDLILSPELREGDHSIWKFLADKRIHHLAIIGPPGCGKTTLLKYVALCLVGHAKPPFGDKISQRLPIFLAVRDHAKTIAENRETTLVELIYESVAQMDSKAPNRWFEKRLAKGKCLIMLDGLDDVADLDTRWAVVKWIENQIQNKLQDNMLIITSRPHGFINNPVRGVNLLRVQSLREDQVKKFVHNWYIENEVMAHKRNDPGVMKKATVGAADLLQMIDRSEEISTLAVNPLLLTMIATVHRFYGKLPERRVELYGRMCDVLLSGGNQGIAPDTELTPAQKIMVLSHLAFEFMSNGRQHLTTEEALNTIRDPLNHVPKPVSGPDFLKSIENQSGIILERESGQYEFSHKTFQEYLAAVHIEKEKLEAKLIESLDMDSWHETTLLYCARNDASEVISACFESELPNSNRLILGIRCRVEAQKVRPDVKDMVVRKLNDWIESPIPEVWKVAALAKLQLRLHYIELGKLDTTAITGAEYQLFLDQQSDDGFVPHHWNDKFFEPGTANQPIVGLIPLQIKPFLNWLGQIDDFQRWSYRLPVPKESVNAEPFWQEDNNKIVLANDEKAINWPLYQWCEDKIELHQALKHTPLRVNGYNLPPAEIIDLAVTRVRSLANTYLFYATINNDVDNRFINNILEPTLDQKIFFDMNWADAEERKVGRNHAYKRALALVVALARLLDISLDPRVIAFIPPVVAGVLRNWSPPKGATFDGAKIRQANRDRVADLIRAIANAERLSVIDRLEYANQLAAAHDLAEIKASSKSLAQYYPPTLVETLPRMIVGYLELVGLLQYASPLRGLEEVEALHAYRRGLLEWANDLMNEKLDTQPHRRNDFLQTELDKILQLYAMVVIFENRRSGKWEAYEQLRIVKANRTESEFA